MTDDQIQEIIVIEDARRSMPEMFVSIKTSMIDLFDNHHTSLTKVVAANVEI